jgi:hypothetical protein
VSEATAVKERPILFGGPMVRAILDGRKSMTRRIVKPQPVSHKAAEPGDAVWYGTELNRVRESKGRNKAAMGLLNAVPFPCPYGVPGDRLRVNESYRVGLEWDDCPPRDIDPRGFAHLGDDIWYEADGKGTEAMGWGRLRPGRFMMRWMSRLTLEVVSVRVERVQDISAKDIITEGAVARAHEDPMFGRCPISAFDGCAYLDLRSLWAAGWDSINGKDSWEANPWVWAVEFKRVERSST